MAGYLVSYVRERLGNRRNIGMVRKFVTALLWYPVLLLFLATSRMLRRNSVVLIIRTDVLGDFAMFLRTSEALQQLHPRDRRVLVVRPQLVDLALVSGVFDEVIPFDPDRYRKNLWYAATIAQKILAIRATTSIYPAYSRTWIGDELTFLSGARICAAFVGDISNITGGLKRQNDRRYTKLVATPQTIVHDLDKLSLFWAALGAALPNPPPHLRFDDADIARRLSPDLVAGLPGPGYVVVAPGASWEGRTWPPEKWKELLVRLNRIHRETNIVMVGSRREEISTNALIPNGMSNVTNLAGKTGVVDLTKVIADARLLIGMESGPAQLAVALGKPVVCLLGGGHFGRFFPYEAEQNVRAVYQKMECYGCNWNCIYDTVRCIEEISVENVLRATLDLLPKEDK